MAKKDQEIKHIKESITTLEDMLINLPLNPEQRQRTEDTLQEQKDRLSDLTKGTKKTKVTRKPDPKPKPKPKQSRSKSARPGKNKEAFDKLFRRAGRIEAETFEQYGGIVDVPGVDAREAYQILRTGSGRIFVVQEDLRVEVKRSGYTIKPKALPKKRTRQAQQLSPEKQQEYIQDFVEKSNDFSDVNLNAFVRKYNADFNFKGTGIDLSKKATFSRQGNIFTVSQGQTSAQFEYGGNGRFTRIKTPKPPRAPKTPKTTAQRNSRKRGVASPQAGYGPFPATKRPNIQITAMPLNRILGALTSQRDRKNLYNLAIEQFQIRQDELTILLGGEQPNSALETMESFLEDLLLASRSATEAREIDLQLARFKKHGPKIEAAILRDLKNPIEHSYIVELGQLVGTTLVVDSKLLKSSHSKVGSFFNKGSVTTLAGLLTGGNPIAVALAEKAQSALDSFFEKRSSDQQELDQLVGRDEEKLRDKQRSRRRELIQNAFSGTSQPLRSPLFDMSGSSFGVGSPEVSYGAPSRQRMHPPMSATFDPESGDTLELILSELQIHTGILRDLLGQNKQWQQIDSARRERIDQIGAELSQDAYLTDRTQPGLVTPKSGNGGIFKELSNQITKQLLPGDGLVVDDTTKSAAIGGAAGVGVGLLGRALLGIAVGAGSIAAGLAAIPAAMYLLGKIPKKYDRRIRTALRLMPGGGVLETIGTLTRKWSGDPLADVPLDFIKEPPNKKVLLQFKLKQVEKKLAQAESEFAAAEAYEQRTGKPGFNAHILDAIASDAVHESKGLRQQKITKLKNQRDKLRKQTSGSNASSTPVAPSSFKLGALTAHSESGGGRNLISTGIGDHGGKSYGQYQLASATGTLSEFLKTSGYGKEFAGLTPGSASFDKKWMELEQSPEFKEAQHKFIMGTHFGPQQKLLQESGIDLSNRGKAVQEMLFSTANQYGPATKLIKRALDGHDVSKMSDAQIIEAVQNYKAANINSTHRSSSENVRQGVLNRIKREKRELISLAQNATASKVAPQTMAMKEMRSESAKLQSQQSQGSTIVNAPKTHISQSTGGGGGGGRSLGGRNPDHTYNQLQMNAFRGLPIA